VRRVTKFGSSLRTAENLETVKGISLEKILLETGSPILYSCLSVAEAVVFVDAPWCSIRPSHPSYGLIPPELLASRRFVAKDKYAPEGTNASNLFVKGRNEPCFIEYVSSLPSTHVLANFAFRDVAQVIAGVKGVSLESVTDTCYKNTLKLFFGQECLE
jgi:Tat protein secretion system quality control protein TatD with DNase activity